jgi:hypothetical protein
VLVRASACTPARLPHPYTTNHQLVTH